MQRVPFRFPTLLASIAALMVTSAHAVGLGEIDLRSYLGQPLDARIPVSAGADEPLDESCFKLINGAITSDAGHATPAKLSFQQVGRNNILLIRSSSTVPEPAVRVQVEVGCGNVSKVSREYILLLDPPEYAAASRINLPANPAAAASPTASVVREAPVATAKSLPATAEGERVGGLSTLSDAAPDALAAPMAPAPKSMRKPRNAGKPPIAQTLRPPRPVARLIPKPAAPAPDLTKPTAPEAEKTVAPPTATSIVSNKVQASEGFRLKLSSTEIDLGRSKSVSDEDRQRMRARQLLLETQSDDQTASMLAMRNSIKQLEGQLAELRAQVGTNKTGIAGNTAGTTQTPPPEATAAPVEVTAPAQPKTAVTSIPVAKPLPKTIVTDEKAFSLADWTVPALAAGAGALALIAGINLWRRRRNQDSATYADLYADASNPKNVPVQPAGQFDEQKLFDDVDLPLDNLEEILPPTAAPTTRSSAPVLDLPVSGTQLRDPRTLVDVQAPDSFKLAYLRERFPEVAQGSLRLDKPDSLIHAARLYYQEDNNSAKATELLEYAIGEYPNEVRPWLALFEIFRLENRKPDFTSLALRFKTWFEHGGYWPKVQAIGRQLDAENSLYAAEEYLTEAHAADQPDISVEAENWLNTPLDFTQDLLGNELRDALLSPEPVAASKPNELSLTPGKNKPA